LKIKVNDYVFPGDSEVTEEAKEFIKKILVGKPSGRLTLKQILNHEYLNS
jgi:serine/threonine protein kinase